ncbi:hypothetical protein HDU98_008923 [Podochytrium sp. JEL0797]|nr:hypothetical protein HDU98_008923 [Podochytrium sp. JEL0797]
MNFLLNLILVAQLVLTAPIPAPAPVPDITCGAAARLQKDTFGVLGCFSSFDCPATTNWSNTQQKCI